MATRILIPFLPALLALACGAPVESTPPPPAEPAPYACGPDGYVLDGAEPGDEFVACASQKIQTTVTTGGQVRGYWEDGCLTLTIESVEPGATELVIQLRGAGGKPMCADAFERVTP